jgi:ribosomal protein L7/L12
VGDGQDSNHPDQLKEVVLLARAGKKIEAIKVYRQMTGCGLVEAKTAVENIQAGQLGQTFNQNPTRPQVGASIPSERMAEINQFIRSGQKIEAIKIYRQVTGVGLREAKDAVEAMGGSVNLNGGLPEFQQKNTAGSSLGSKLLILAGGLFFFGIASIFPLVFIPMGISSWQGNDIGGAIGSFFGAGIWAVVWGGIGCAIIYGGFALSK